MLPTVVTQGNDWHAHGDIKDASRTGDYGAVIRRARRVRGMTQSQFAGQCGLTQSAVSRLENSRSGSYNMITLAKAATALGLPFELVGLANQKSNGISPVERREFLATGLAAAIPAAPAPSAGPTGGDSSPAAALRLVTTSYRRLDATTISSDLADTVHGHLRLIQSIAQSETDAAYRARVASAGSEAASFAAWLAWDMADYGSARRWYGSSIKAAHASGDKLLVAYQIGSLASFEADTGAPHEALRLVSEARHHLDNHVPVLATVWLASIEAIAHASKGDRSACERALRACERHASKMPAGPVVWPWIFAFDERKIASCRITCAARLASSLPIRVSDKDIGVALSNGNDKQRALLTIDAATSHLRSGDADAAFALASRALGEGIRLRSGKIVERARRLRSTYTDPGRTAMVREFDAQLHATYL
ncbi:helix-turn-helix transcriptional regulator [Streptomyces sp. NPDC047987]|uniref:helix-turn-helix domain-containing protein n=1 Tax=unclassified Streptomyces TaxID=2593676 RepID=UPI00342A08F8